MYTTTLGTEHVLYLQQGATVSLIQPGLTHIKFNIFNVLDPEIAFT